MVVLARQLTSIVPNDPNYWINLAKLEQKNGNTQAAINAANKVSELDPKLKADVDKFIAELQKEGEKK